MCMSVTPDKFGCCQKVLTSQETKSVRIEMIFTCLYFYRLPLKYLSSGTDVFFERETKKEKLFFKLLSIFTLFKEIESNNVQELLVEEGK